MNRLICCNYKIIDSEFGKIIILWKYKNDIPKIVKIILAGQNSGLINEITGCLENNTCNIIEETAENILKYFSGKIVVFNTGIIDISQLSILQKKVLQYLPEIKRGCVLTYKELSEKLKIKNGARAVGNILASNPFPVILPCHRVVKSGGLIGGYYGGSMMKKKLLELEGIKFGKNDKILPK